MTTPFIHDDFLLESEVARDLYHRFVEELPIIDYHCHLPVKQIADDHRFRSLTEIWLDGDHYKWRAMRANGVNERLITGDASDREKFEAWARTVPATIRNPLYHWTAMELKRPFGVTDLLSDRTARAIFERCNELLGTPEFSTQGLLRQFGVAVVCTTDDPTDSLEHHQKLAQRKNPETRVVPTWRPDAAIAIDNIETFNAWLARLEAASNTSIIKLADLLDALAKRFRDFHALGCRASDHGFESIPSGDFTIAAANNVFDKLRSGNHADADEARQYKLMMLHGDALMAHRAGWVQQYHLGALRNTNTRMRRMLGADSGLDSVGDFEMARPMARFFDRLDSTSQLAKTILYNLNPRDNELFATMIGNFQDGSVAGKMQYGAAWWFLDQKDGMEAQLRALSNMGLFSRFVGMVTDSRSFLSYSRHEYFRRLVCNLLGDDVKRGFLPDDRELLGNVARDIAFFNARKYFGFDV